MVPKGRFRRDSQITWNLEETRHPVDRYDAKEPSKPNFYQVVFFGPIGVLKDKVFIQ